MVSYQRPIYWVQLSPVRLLVEQSCACGFCHSRTHFRTELLCSLGSHPRWGPARPGPHPELLRRVHQRGARGRAQLTQHWTCISLLTVVPQSQRKSQPWECAPMKNSLQAQENNFVWNDAVLKNSSVSFPPWCGSAGLRQQVCFQV